MDLGTIQYNVDANTSGVTQAEAAIDNMADAATRAGVATEQMGEKAERAGRKTQQAMATAGNQSKRSTAFAQQFGLQMQDSIVQLQAGTSAFTVFAQQGSQLFSVFSPMLGLFVALTGVVGGMLFSSLMKSNAALEDMDKTTRELLKSTNELTLAQRGVVNAAVGHMVEDLTQKYVSQTDAINDQRKALANLQELQGRDTFTVALEEVARANQNILGVLGRVGSQAKKIALFQFDLTSFDTALDYADDMAEKQKVITALEIERIKIMRELFELQGWTVDKTVTKLAQEVQLVGLTGRAYWELKATQEGLVGINRQLYIDLNLQKEASEKKAEADKKAADEADKLAEKERARVEAVTRLAVQMEREVDLSGQVSRAAQVEYDIKAGLIKVTGGLAGAEAQRLLSAAKAVDATRAQNAAQEDYVRKLQEWVTQKNNQKASVDSVIESLTRENAELTNTADGYLELQLRAKGAEQSQIDAALALSRTNRTLKDQAARMSQMYERLDEAGAAIWGDLLNGSRNAFDAIGDMFKNLLAEMAHEAVTRPIMLNIQQAMSGGKGGKDSGSLLSGIGVGGIYAAAGVAVVAAVNSWNKEQDKKFAKMAAEYRQGVQSTGTILGEANRKSESIANSSALLASIAANTLDVNHGMYTALVSIEKGINGVAAGFARQFGLSTGATGTFGKVNEGTVAGAEWANFKSTTDAIQKYIFFGGDAVTNFVDDFVTGLVSKVNKEIYKKKTKIIDSGIQFMGQSLASILEAGTVQAFAYADVKTTKKFLGVTTSNKVKTLQEEMDAVLLGQFADVFGGAGDALREAATVFGLDFEKYINKLVVDPQKLSLDKLEGDALTKEIEAFFSSTLDNWAETLMGGARAGIDLFFGGKGSKGQSSMAGVLQEFQRVGEGAFETVIRLASELNTFTQYAKLLQLDFPLMGGAAVRAQQNIADLAGGMDQLTSSLSGYYQNFFSESERNTATMERLAAEFRSLGYNTVPATRAEFRSLVEGLDLTTAAGQKNFAALMGLQGAFADLVPVIDNMAKSAEELRMQAAEAAVAALGRAVDAERESLTKQIDGLNDSLSNSRSIFNGLENALQGLAVTSAESARATRRQAQAQLSSMLGAARGGALPDLAALNNALSVLTQPNVNQFSTFQEYALDMARTAAEVKSLQDIAGTQVTNEERQLAELERQSAFLDEVSKWGQQQLDQLKGIDTSVVSVTTAINNLAAIVGTGFPQGALAYNIAANSAAPAPVAAIPDPAEVAARAKAEENAEHLRAMQYSLLEVTNKVFRVLDDFQANGTPIAPESATAIGQAVAEALP